MRLEDLNDSDLEKIASGELESLSDQVLEAVASQDAGDAPADEGSMLGAATSGLGGLDKYSGLNVRNAVEFLGQNAGPIIGGFAGSAGGPLGMAAGAALGRVGQNAWQSAASSAGLEARSPSIGETAKEAAVEGVGNYLGAKYLPAVGEAAKAVGKTAYNRMAATFGRIPMPALDRAWSRAGEVLSSAARNPDAASNMADAFRQSINAVADTAGDAYRGMVSLIKSDAKYGPGFKMNAQKEIGDKLAKIANDYGYVGVGKLEDTAAAKSFLETIGRANALADASVEQVYYFQRRLNNLAREHVGTELGTAFNKAKGVVKDWLEKRVPEIGQANREYAAAQDLLEEADVALKQNDLAGWIRRTMQGPEGTKAKDALEYAMSKAPGAKEAVEGTLDALAGREFADPFKALPATGFTAGAGALTLGGAAGNPLALAGMAAISPFMSPRLVGLGIKGASAASPYVSKAGMAALPAESQALPGLINAYMRDRKAR